MAHELHIGTVLLSLRVGGAERVVATLIRTWQELDTPIRSTVFAFADGPMRSQLEESGADVHVIPSQRALNPINVLRLRRAFSSAGIDLVHAHLPRPTFFARLAARSLHLPIVNTEHSLWAFYHPISRWALRTTFSLSDAVIAVSDEGIRSMAAYSPKRTRGLVRRIHNGVRAPIEKKLGTLRGELQLSDEAPLIATVARLHPSKDLPTLLRALEMVRVNGTPCTLAILGRDDGEGPMLSRLAESLGIQSSIAWMGFRSDATHLIADADVFVLSSIYEGMPVALLEAMALGLPSVVTDVGGNTEAVVHGDCGLVVPPRNPTVMAQAISELIRDHKLRDRLADHARQRYMTAFTSEAMAEAYFEVYREVLSAAQTRGRP